MLFLKTADLELWRFRNDWANCEGRQSLLGTNNHFLEIFFFFFTVRLGGGKSEQEPFTFSQALRLQGIKTSGEEKAPLSGTHNQLHSAVNDGKPPDTAWCQHLTVDWSLKSKLRFITDKPLPWKHTFKVTLLYARCGLVMQKKKFFSDRVFFFLQKKKTSDFLKLFYVFFFFFFFFWNMA